MKDLFFKPQLLSDACPADEDVVVRWHQSEAIRRIRRDSLYARYTWSKESQNIPFTFCRGNQALSEESPSSSVTNRILRVLAYVLPTQRLFFFVFIATDASFPTASNGGDSRLLF